MLERNFLSKHDQFCQTEILAESGLPVNTLPEQEPEKHQQVDTAEEMGEQRRSEAVQVSVTGKAQEEKKESFLKHVPGQDHLALFPRSVQNWMIPVILARFSMLTLNQLQEVSEYPENSNPQQLPTPVSFVEAIPFHEKL